MPLHDLIATPHPDGHRIDLKWANPEPSVWPGVRVVRREHTHPAAPDDGVLVADGTNLALGLDALGRALYHVTDTGLKGETTYYYSLFPYSGAPPDFEIDRANRLAALSGSAHGTAARMFELLPALYHRYDDEAGRLRRFLDLPGGEFDLLYSFARALPNLYDVDRVAGHWLPLLAEWIGWKTDFRLDVEAQRNEVRSAPEIYRRVGMIPVVGATVKRISGWESRAKEFVHNVARSNQPPRLNHRARLLDETGETQPDTETGEPLDTLLSLNFAYEGRPAVAEDEHGVRWFFYHTLRRNRWRLWCKTSPTFGLGLDARSYLDTPDVAALQRALAEIDIEIAADATVTAIGSRWRIDDVTNVQTYIVEEGEEALMGYHTSAHPLAFAPSGPLTSGDGVAHEKYPTAVLQGDALWLFWAEYDAEAGRWTIRFRIRADGEWSSTSVFTQGGEDPGEEEALPERRAPAACVDRDGGLWLFWMERTGTRWQLRYNRHDGTGLDANPASGWELAAPETFPADTTGSDPRVEDDVFVLSHDDEPTRSLWVFWARKDVTTDPAQTRWSIAYRVKQGIDPADASDWGAVETLPKPDEEAHDREPAAQVRADGTLEVFWSSNREGSWSLWRAVFDPVSATWSAAEALTNSPYAERNPLPHSVGDDTLLLYRSSQSLAYASDVYRATETVDFRYAGATTVHTRNTALTDLRGEFEDFQTYTYDTGSNGTRTNDNWYARDTIGLYLEADTADPEALASGITRLSNVLPEFMPVTDRAVFIARTDTHAEYVYTYDRPGAPDPRFITELYADALTAPSESALPVDEDFTDNLL